MPKGYISLQSESVRMFESDLLEFCSHIHPATPLFIFGPLVGLLILFSVSEDAVAFLLLFYLAGLGLWTLAEYLLHRFVFHHRPKNPWVKRLHFLIHGVHHDYPNDATRLVMAPVISIPLAIAFYSTFRLILGPGLANPLFAGFVTGYLGYDMLHYAVHHFPMTGKLRGFLKHYHLRHHFQDETRGFGVSSPVWDYVFGTRPVEGGAKPPV